MAREWTEKQLQAINTRDRTLLVSAAAGSGKTATLTERIIRSLLDEENPVDISEMLIVTFTNAATGELSERIAAAIRSAMENDPGNERLARQLRLLPSARISTIDAFCSDILRAHCERVGVSPGYRIADEAEAQLLAEGILDGMFSEIYEGNLSEVATPEELEALADCLTDTKSQGDLSLVIRMFYDSTKDTELGVGTIRELVREYDTEGFSGVENTRLGAHVMRVLSEMCEHYSALVDEAIREHLENGSPKLLCRLEILRADKENLAALSRALTYTEARTLLMTQEHEKSVRVTGFPEIKNPTAMRAAMKAAREGIRTSLFEYSEEEWVESYNGLYAILSVLVRIIEEFHRAYKAEKLRLGICEYSDVSRYTYECLWQSGEKTDVAISESAKYKAVYIDEYQDVNALQHRIFEAIGSPTNRFMVGDIKQSIYGFRSADPTIFADMKKTFPELKSGEYTETASVFMSDNFRCDRTIIDYVNGIFDNLFYVLRESIGFVPEDRLNSKKAHGDGHLVLPELCLLPYRTEDQGAQEDDGDENEGEDTPNLQAEVVAEKIAELLRDGKLDSGEPIRPGDIAIIMRNAKGKDKKYAAALTKRGIPSAVSDTTSFFLNSEVLLVMSILHTIDNPRRDIYLAGALCSPVFGFSADELAKISSLGEPSLYDNLVAYTKENPDYSRGVRFLGWLARYRALSEGCAVDVLISRLYHECGVLALASRSGGKDHLLRLLEHARQFENSTFRGLYNFISYINGVIDRNNSFDKREANVRGDAVKIITAHSSKGLEFPVVFFVGAEQAMKRTRDEKERLVYETRFGIGMYLRTPSGLSLVSNPTKKVILSYRLRQKIEEEARVLYVILTRARERLYIVGKCTRGYEGYEENIIEAHSHLTPYAVYGMKSYTDMITYSSGCGFMTPDQFLSDMPKELSMALVGAAEDESKIAGVPAGEGLFDLPEELPFAFDGDGYDGTRVELSNLPDDEKLSDVLYERFCFKYPHEAHTRLPEKLSVSRLYPEILNPEEEATLSLYEENSQEKLTKMGKLPAFATGSGENESAKRGIATHLYFQFCDFARLMSDGAAAELERLKDERFLTQRDAERVRLREVEAFSKSSLMKKILEARRLWRELRFNTRIPASYLSTDPNTVRELEGAEILVQGVIDCLFEDSSGELHLVDYKTDRLTKEERDNPALAEKRLYDAHSLQLAYYSEAVLRMFGKRPITVEVYSLHLGRCVDVRREL